MIAVIDNGICNLRSVTKALESVAACPVVVRTPAELDAAGAHGLVLPGVGALRDCVASLRETGLAESVRDWVGADKPFLGVCLGMQALFERSEEGDIEGLGIFRGSVKRFALPSDFKIPHMGWNTVRFAQPESPLRGDLAVEGESFYFVHSYYAEAEGNADIAGRSHYGVDLAAAVARDNIFAVQFHPEKSARAGLQLLKNFTDWNGTC